MRAMALAPGLRMRVGQRQRRGATRRGAESLGVAIACHGCLGGLCGTTCLVAWKPNDPRLSQRLTPTGKTRLFLRAPAA
jgi:hypothetical protein